MQQNFIAIYQFFPQFLRVIGSVFLIFLGGCNQEKIQVYRVAKEKTLPPSPQMPGHSLPVERLEWTTPPEWKQQEPSGMRYGSFLITGKNETQADVSILFLSGDGGGALANINRWREQLGLPPIVDGQLSSQSTQLEVLGKKVILVDLVSQKSTNNQKEIKRILAAILPRDNISWFFKMTGDDSLVSAHKERFIQLVKSARFSSSEEIENLNPEPSNGQTLKWKLPKGWKEEAASGMRKGSFSITGKNNMQTDVSIISLAGEAGGSLANVNRWRTQIELPPLTETDLNKIGNHIKIQDREVLLVNMLSSNTLANKRFRTRILGAILIKGGNSWFFKMMGDDALVEEQKDAFIDFVKSTKIP